MAVNMTEEEVKALSWNQLNTTLDKYEADYKRLEDLWDRIDGDIEYHECTVRELQDQLGEVENTMSEVENTIDLLKEQIVWAQDNDIMDYTMGELEEAGQMVLPDFSNLQNSGG